MVREIIANCLGQEDPFGLCCSCARRDSSVQLLLDDPDRSTAEEKKCLCKIKSGRYFVYQSLHQWKLVDEFEREDDRKDQDFGVVSNEWRMIIREAYITAYINDSADVYRA